MSRNSRHDKHSPEPSKHAAGDDTRQERSESSDTTHRPEERAGEESHHTESAHQPDEQPEAGTRTITPQDLKELRRRIQPTEREIRVSRYFLIGLLAVVTLAFIPIIRFFVVPLILATTFTALFFPLYRRWYRTFKGNRGIASLATCAVLLLGLLIPAYVVIHLVVQQAFDLYTIAEPTIKELFEKGEESRIVQWFLNLPIVSWLQLQRIDWLSALQETVRASSGLVTTVINRTSAGVFSLVLNLFVMLFTMFYFFMDGENIIQRIKFLSPLRSEYEDLIFSRFLLISRATVKGTFLIGVTQGTLGALTLLIFGVRAWLLWGFVMVILSIIPMVGAWLVLIPAAVIQIILGNVWQGIGIVLSSTIVISNVDNLIRPRLVGYGAKMHDLMIFFSTLGGIAVFGVMGFIIGPAIAALFITIVDIYGAEFQDQLTMLENAGKDE
jgi:predicted PurR-regulated permease PerM